MNLWQKLTDPHASITDIEQRQESRLLAGLVVSLAGTSLLASGLLIGLAGGVSSTVIGLWFCILFMLAVYFLNRSGRYRLSALIFVGFNLIVTNLMPILTHELAWLLFTPMVVLLSAMLLPDFTAATFVICLISQVLLAIVFPLTTSMSSISVMIVYSIIGPLILVFMYHRIRLEQERQEELRTINVSLLRSEAKLESRVLERTAELSTANEKMQGQLEEINLLQDKLFEEAIRDPLTSLFNRRYLQDALLREIARARRGKLEISFMLLDVDHFKQINDVHGHGAGDSVLIALSKQLQAWIRLGDIPCRIGGEEFVLVLPGMPDATARTRAEHFRSEIERMRVPHEGRSLAFTVSIGIAAFPQNGANWEELYHAADQALYRAKESGRNRVEHA